jgi:hypothetical protein
MVRRHSSRKRRDERESGHRITQRCRIDGSRHDKQLAEKAFYAKAKIKLTVSPQWNWLLPSRVASGTRSILIREAAMPTCETCGNDYDKAFQVTLNGSTHTFDSFECAIQALAPTCPHCGTHVVGHGVENDGTIFCCAHCAKQEGVTQLRDRA